MSPAMGVDSMTEAQRLAEVEKQRQQVLQEAREVEQIAREHKVPARAKELARHALWHQGRARIVDFDPKQGGVYYNRIYCVDHATFDFDEESPLEPMRYADRVSTAGDELEPCTGVNIFTVKIASLDISFPIHVYGTVIARDSLDKKCLYLFRRDRNHCQLINSEDDSLILTGPKRGIALIDDDHVEIDLKVKYHGGQDRELSKGYVKIKGMSRRRLKKCEVETQSLATRLSTIDVMYAVVKDAVEGTIAIEVLQGNFLGEITAHARSIKNTLVLYDSEVAGGNGNGFFLLMRRVVCVNVMDMLRIDFKTGDGRHKRFIEFTPQLSGPEQDVISVGATKMLVKVTWSIMDF